MWLFRAGQESCSGLPTGSRAAVYAWTVPATASRGDLILLYGREPLRALAGFGRVCSEPVKSRRSSEHWAWVQMLGLAEQDRVQLEDLQADPRAGQLKTLRNLAGSHSRVPDGPALDGIVDRMVAHNKARRTRWEAWSTGSAPYPRDVDPQDLRDAKRPPEPRFVPPSASELALHGKLERLLGRTGVARPLEDEDAVRTSKANHLVFDGGSWGFADLVLVRGNARGQALMLIEVKLSADPQLWRDGVSQIRLYRPALRDVARGWRIESYLVAKRIDDRVLAQCRAAKVVPLLWRDKPRQTLEPAPGHDAPSWLTQLP